MSVGRATPMPSIASNQTASHCVGDLVPRPLLALARSMILSSMSVMLETRRTVEPGPLEVAAQHVVHERRPAVAEVRRAVDGRAAQVDARPCRARAGRARGPRRVAVSYRRSTPAIVGVAAQAVSRGGCRSSAWLRSEVAGFGSLDLGQVRRAMGRRRRRA